MTTELRPFRIEVPEHALDDLRDRLRRTRWPESETVDDWSQGIPLAYMRDLCAYWAEEYDWRATEARLGGHPHYLTEIDGLDIHFLHVRSPHPGALPLVLTHGWPGSIVEFHKVLGPLTDPVGDLGDGLLDPRRRPVTDGCSATCRCGRMGGFHRSSSRARILAADRRGNMRLGRWMILASGRSIHFLPAATASVWEFFPAPGLGI